MNWDEMQGKWKQVKGSVHQQFGKLTDDDFEMIAGQREKLIGKLQERYGYAREEAQKRADEWMRTMPAQTSSHQQPPPTHQRGEAASHSQKR